MKLGVCSYCQKSGIDLREEYMGLGHFSLVLEVHSPDEPQTKGLIVKCQGSLTIPETIYETEEPTRWT